MTADELATLSEHAARLIAGGGGLKALAQMLADATKGAVLVEDEQWRHLALAEPGRRRRRAAAILRALLPQGAQGVARTAPWCAARSPVRCTRCARTCRATGESDAPCGYVTLFVRGASRADASPALRIVASAAAIEACASRQRARAGAPGVLGALPGRWISDAADLKAQASALGINLPPSFVRRRLRRRGRDPAERARHGASGACARGRDLSAVPARAATSSPCSRCAIKVDVARARQAAANALRDLPRRPVTLQSANCGIGSLPRPTCSASLQSLREAREALSLGRRLFGRGAMAIYPDLGIYALLHAGADRAGFVEFAERLIEPLQAYDRKHKTDLVATLTLYFEVGENVKEAAERLSVHRHTIFYRLNQISQILKTDLKTPKGSALRCERRWPSGR